MLITGRASQVKLSLRGSKRRSNLAATGHSGVRLLCCARNDGNSPMSELLGLPPGAFDRIDEEDDAAFYEEPRLVYHIDDHAVAALTGFYRALLPAGGVLLDLMSSWVSHLPP